MLARACTCTRAHVYMPQGPSVVRLRSTQRCGRGVPDRAVTGSWQTCQEFAAHSGNVQCVAIGRRSFKVLATGGDDRKVLFFLSLF